jgi:SpoIID/LytB domain protein
LEARSGNVELRLGDPANGEVVATIPDGQTWRVRVADTRYRIIDQSGHTVDRVGGPNAPIFAVFQPQRAHVRIPEASHTYNRGWIEFGLYSCAGSCEMRLVLVITPQEYLYGLGEVPSSWPTTALKAQAIAARTYAFTKAASTQHRSVCDCALYASSFDQVYAGWDKEGALDGDRWVRAVDDTDDRVVVDAGDTIQAFYMSSSGGFTEDNENVWGGTPIGYLRGVCDPGDYVADNPNRVWQASFEAGSLTTGLRKYTGDIGTVTRFAEWTLGVSGRVTSVRVKGTKGTSVIEGWDIRSGLALKDTRFSINRNLNVTGTIRDEYDRIACRPGRAVSAQKKVRGGREQRFVSGRMYENRRRNAVVWLRGAVLGEYLRVKGPRGRLGLPLRYKAVKGGARAWFDRGTITCTPRCRVRLR